MKVVLFEGGYYVPVACGIYMDSWMRLTVQSFTPPKNTISCLKHKTTPCPVSALNMFHQHLDQYIKLQLLSEGSSYDNNKLILGSGGYYEC